MCSIQVEDKIRCYLKIAQDQHCTANVPLPRRLNQEKTDYWTGKNDSEKKIFTKCEMYEGVEERNKRTVVVATSQSMDSHTRQGP